MKGIVRIVAALGLAGALLLGQASHAGDPEELNRLAVSASMDLPMDTQLHVASSMNAGASMTSEEVILLLRAGVSPAVIWKYSRGKFPTEHETTEAGKPGPRWETQRRPKASSDAERDAAAGDSPVAGSPKVEGPYYTDGHPWYRYTDSAIEMTAAVISEGRFTMVLVAITNIGDSLVTVFPSAFKLGRTDGRTTAQLERIAPSEYMKKLTRSSVFRQVLVALTTPVAMGTVSRSTTTGSVGQTSFSATTTTVTGPSTQDRIAAHAYRAEVMHRSRERERERLTEADDLLFRANTLEPGGTTSGVIPFDYRSQPSERFFVRFDAEQPVKMSLHTRD